MTERPALIHRFSKLLRALLVIAIFAPLLHVQGAAGAQDGPLQVVATTTQATDL
ncbi:MAG: hypothetical protein AVDCRST_MAG93-9235, partial [uncultured Chloroflexia bacterium]